MLRRPLLLVSLLLALALPLSASQFIQMPFDDVAREASLIVRGTIDETWSQWDSNREVIYTYATVRVTRYFGEATGPDTIIVREVGGTVDGYTQEAIGFPAIRRGEKVVLLLSQWEDSSDYRIHAFNQGKYLVRERAGVEILVSDPITQGHERLRHDRFELDPHSSEQIENGLRMDEFAAMVEDARAGKHHGAQTLREQQ
jgi:hypothetical protein